MRSRGWLGVAFLLLALVRFVTWLFRFRL